MIQKFLCSILRLVHFLTINPLTLILNVFRPAKASAGGCPFAKKKSKPVPSYFEEKDESKLFEIIEKNSFAVAIMTNDDGTIQLCHAPFYIDREERTVRGHLARRNPMFQLMQQGRPITLVFSGPHAYVSPQFYLSDKYSKVPTWNYCYAHIHGTTEVMEEEGLIKILDDLSVKYEGKGPNAWKLAEMDKERLKGANKQIFGVKIKIDRVEGDFEFALDADDDKIGVLRGLKARNQELDRSLAEVMSKAWKIEDY